MTTPTTVTVNLEVIDGCLYVRSDDLPGLILSGDDHAAVKAEIFPAVEALLNYQSARPVEFKKIALEVAA